MPRLPGAQPIRIEATAQPNFALSVGAQGDAEMGVHWEQVAPLVKGVEIEYDEDMSSRLEVHLHQHPNSPPGQKVDWEKVLDNKAIQEGNVLECHMGYGIQMEHMGRFEIPRWLPRFGELGPELLKLKCYDARHRMMESHKASIKGPKKRKHAYRNKPDEAIVEEIAEKYGFGSDVDATDSRLRNEVTLQNGQKKVRQVYPVRVQSASQNDWRFLQRLADIHRFDLWVDWDVFNKRWVLHFKRRLDAGAATYHFEYNGGNGAILSFEPDFLIKDQPTDVEVLYYDRGNREIARTIVSETTRAENVSVGSARGGRSYQANREIIQGAAVRFSAFGQTVQAISDQPFRNKAEAERFALHYLKERERDLLTVEGRLVGLPMLRPRQICLVTGFSKRLDGYYRFTNVTHPMMPDSEYECSFKAHKILSQDVLRQPQTTKAR